MTPEQFAELSKKLDQIIALLELQTFGPDEPCLHPHTKDMGVMGDKLGEHMRCLDCGADFSRIEEAKNG